MSDDAQNTDLAHIFVDECEADGLPRLSEKNQEFVKLLTLGKTQADAYALSRGLVDYNVKSAEQSGCRLAAHPKVKAWLDYIKSAVADNIVCSKETHLAELARLSASAERNGNYGAAVNAEIARGKVAGLYVDRQEFVDLTPLQIIEQVRELLGDGAAVEAGKMLLEDNLH